MLEEELQKLEEEVVLATARLQAEQVAYRTARMRLKAAQIEAGIIKPEEAVMKFVAEVRDRIDCMKSRTVRDVLDGLCDAIEGKGGERLLDLDDKFHQFEQ